MDDQANFEYSGVENLEAMEEAVNYNGFLLNTLKRHLSGDDVLDFGAGGGAFALPLKADGVDVRCVEPDERLRGRLAASELETYADIAEVDLASVDCVYTMNVLEHIEDDRAMLGDIHDKIRPGGRLIIYVPAFNILYGKMDELVGHFRRYRRDDLVEKVKAVGFAVEKARYVDSLGFFAALVFRWLGNDSGVISPRSVKLYDRLLFPLSRVLDHIVFGSFGKNLLVVATRPQ
jgi:2-polyprenyl-3-methyl-5-hydroxy-6-metoxy-1,4-benzoquinol methylase